MLSLSVRMATKVLVCSTRWVISRHAHVCQKKQSTHVACGLGDTPLLVDGLRLLSGVSEGFLDLARDGLLRPQCLRALYGIL